MANIQIKKPWTYKPGSGDVKAANYPGLVSYWDFNGNARDKRGAHHGAITGATWTTTQHGHALEFDANGEVVNCGVVPEVLGATKLTVFVDFIFTDTNPVDWRGIFGAQSSSTFRTSMGFSGGGYAGFRGLHLFFGNGSNTHAYAAALGALTVGERYRIFFVFDGGGAADSDKVKLYVNKVDETLTFAGVSPPTSLHSTSVDWEWGDQEGYRTGGMKMLAAGIFSRALPAAEVESITDDSWQLLQPRTVYVPYAAAGGAPTGSISEGVTWSEVFSAKATAAASITEGISAGDSDAGAGAALGSLAAGASLSDAQAALAQAVAAINAGLSAGEAWASSAQAIATLAEAAQLGDTFTGATTGAQTGALAEGLSASEAFVAAVQALASLTDGLSIGALITSQAAANASIAAAESLGATFTAEALGAFTGALTAGTTASESFVAAVQALSSLTEQAVMDSTFLAQSASSGTIEASITLGAEFSYAGVLGCLIAAVTIAAAVSSEQVDSTPAIDGSTTIAPATGGSITKCP